MRYLRNKRGLAGVGALAAVIGVTLWVVLPAVASTVGDRVGPRSNPAGQQGVYPIDVGIGGNGVCSNLFPSLGGVKEYDNPNPKTGTYDSGNGDNVKFDLQMDPTNLGKDLTPAWTKDAYMNVAVSNTGDAAKIVGIGVNGGTDSTTYTYGGVSGDTYLHAPAQAWKPKTDSAGSYEWPSKLYSISHLTICYALGSISGTVNQDTTPSLTQPTLKPQQGWTLHLYDGSGNLIRTTTSDANGSYTFAANFEKNTTYTVCEVPASGTWAQETPDPSEPDRCSATGELPRGDQFTPTDASGTGVLSQDFVNVSAGCSDSPFGITGSYLIKLAETCAQKQNSFVFTQGSLPDSNTSNPDHYWVGYWADDQTQPQTPVVEWAKLPDPIGSDGLPMYDLAYDDSGGLATLTTLDSLTPMQYCKIDPRDLATDTAGFTLKSDYTTVTPSTATTGSGAVLPSGQTSCRITYKVYVDASGQGWAEAFVYSLADTIKGMR